jgi:hypothetical protein
MMSHIVVSLLPVWLTNWLMHKLAKTNNNAQCLPSELNNHAGHQDIPQIFGRKI